MNQSIILYQSKYGSTKKYAEWLREELSCDITETKKADITKISNYNTIILGGGIYAGNIAGLSFIKKHSSKLKDKNIIIFAIGALPYIEEAVAKLRKNIPEIAHLFYLRGAWDQEVMTGKDKLLTNMVKKMLSKKDPAKYEPSEAALMEIMDEKNDWVDKDNLEALIDHIKSI